MTLNISEIARYFYRFFTITFCSFSIILYKVFYCSGGKLIKSILIKNMAEYFCPHRRGLRTLEIPGKAGRMGADFSLISIGKSYWQEGSNKFQNQGFVSKGDIPGSGVFSIFRRGEFVLFGNCRVGSSRDGNHCLIKSLSLAPDHQTPPPPQCGKNNLVCHTFY